ncbi:MAG: hypothetical protein RR367_08790 [Clostridia bacterium]
MTEHELYDWMQQEQHPIPEGFEERSDLLLQKLAHQERKGNVKKIVLIALAATLLLGSIAYAATQVDLVALVFGNQAATPDQNQYVTEGTQYAVITRVASGESARGDYQRNSLVDHSVQDAYIANITSFVDGARLVIGFTKAKVGKEITISCDDFFVNDEPVAGGLMEKEGVYSLDAELPTALLGKELHVVLPLQLFDENQATGYQYIFFDMQTMHVENTARISAKLSDQMTLTLLEGTFSPLGLRIPLQIEGGPMVSFYGDYECFLNDQKVDDAWQGGYEEADDVIALNAATLPEKIELRMHWQETEGGNVYECTGAATFYLISGQTTIADVAREFAYQQPGTTPTPTFSGDVACFDLNVAPHSYTLKPRRVDMAQLAAIAEAVITREVLQSAVCVEESATQYTYYADASRKSIIANVWYDPSNGELDIMGPGATDENWLGDVDAPNCKLSRADAKTIAEAFMAQLGYTRETLRLERTEAFVANRQGGYYLYINVLDDGMPRYVNRGGYVGSQWRLMIKERGVCQVTGRLVDVTAQVSIKDALTIQEAQQKVLEAVQSGQFNPFIHADAALTEVRAVSYDPNRNGQNGSSANIPVWEFDFLEDGSDWVLQICVNRQTGEIFNPQDTAGMPMVMQ